MCGLFGFADINQDRLCPDDIERGRRALHVLSHRGPDQWSDHVDGNVFVGHRRLSILDLSDAGRQPMVSSDSRVAIAVNGEIYNHQELRRQLPRAPFHSRSDSEVVLHGYLEWGDEKLFRSLNGMFAAVVADMRSGTITLARDRVGVKPLYYAWIDNVFAWASELKAIQAFFRPEQLRLDETALYDALTYRYVPSPKSLYRNVWKTLPGQLITFSLAEGRIARRSYWQLEPETRQITADEAKDHTASLVRRSVREQLMTDVPLGVFLSGGVDSSILTACSAPLMPGIKTFTIGFLDQPGKDETPYAAAVATRYGTDHHVKTLAEGDAEDFIDWLTVTYDEPFADSSALPTQRLCAFTRQRVTVALGGDGADELFGGYKWHGNFDRWRRLQAPGRLMRLPQLDLPFRRPSTNVFQKIGNRIALYTIRDPVLLYQALMSGSTSRERQPYRDLLEIPRDYDDYWFFRRHWRPELGTYRALQYLDFHTFLPDDILTKVDRASMAHSLEVRVPFLSNELIDFAFAVPERATFASRAQPKALLKAAFADDLPAEILRRDKQGFSAPTQAWGATMLQGSRTLQEAVVKRFLDVKPLRAPREN